MKDMKNVKKNPRRLVLKTLTVRTLTAATGGDLVAHHRKCHEVDSIYDPWSNKLVTK